ncbi:DUF4157 domain-containing protein [Massilia sp. DJPM01]|uniref:eCIS core domain-containing protein n=1 Tax=Massilia sp. DJPM01 TaxID=3024404 RepID=UPI00259EF06F|nr:DUF4157 domain-containing protein [Massilia sp. DJPM01]MDM5179909.1 DUF4157 domain-containing protein [Massilia sp. DJPM01]
MHAPSQPLPQTGSDVLADAVSTAASRNVAQRKANAGKLPETVAQRKLAAMIDNSAHMLQRQAIADRIDTSTRMLQRQPGNALHDHPRMVAQRRETGAPTSNHTGLPDQLKSGIESLFGISMDHVKVHFNSSRPAQLHAHAYAQGSDIHLGPGQSAHLPHEAWHVVQQAQGRVRPTMQMKAGVAVNDDEGLEREADVMGARAMQMVSAAGSAQERGPVPAFAHAAVAQRAIIVSGTEIAFTDGAIAFHAFRDKFPAASSEHLYQVLTILCTQPHEQYQSLDEVAADIEKLLALQPAAADVNIEHVMEAVDSLGEFTKRQDQFQSSLQSMEGLQSAGFEFEFASFTETSDTPYSGQEIIPSHQEMGKSIDFGNYFKLPWKLESDALNTLELVTPPFVFPKNQDGNAARGSVVEKMAAALPALATAAEEGKSNLPRLAAAMAAVGLGRGWTIESAYQNFGAIKKVKSGSEVYSQTNASLYPAEIGQLLEMKFAEYDSLRGAFDGTAPANLARRMRYAFDLKADAEAPLKQAVAVFARYASNVLAIPSMMHRQATQARKDNMPTDVKETLAVWVKTDALNVLKGILTTDESRESFSAILQRCRPAVVELLSIEGKKMQDVAKREGESKARKFETDNPLKSYMPDPEIVKSLDLPGKKAALTKGQLEQKNAYDAFKLKLEQELVAMQIYVTCMMTEARAFIDRALAVGTHELSIPTSTTKEFLSEVYGSGEGVRKGTYLGGIATKDGPMYVTETR